MKTIIFSILSVFLTPFFAQVSRAQTFSFKDTDLKVIAGEEVSFGINVNSAGKQIRGFQVQISLPENIVVTNISSAATGSGFEAIPEISGYKGGSFIMMALDTESDSGYAVEGELLTVTIQSTGSDPLQDLQINFTNPLVAYSDGSKAVCEGPATLKLEVVVPVSQISIQPENDKIYAGDSKSFTATVFPANASNSNVFWELIQDDDYAEISSQEDNGVTVRGIAPGSVILKCTAVDGYGAETIAEIEIL